MSCSLVELLGGHKERVKLLEREKDRMKLIEGGAGGGDVQPSAFVPTVGFCGNQ